MTAIKLLPVGGSLGVELPQHLLDRLRLKAGDALWLVETGDGGFQISSAAPEVEAQMRLAREGMGAYRLALHELAK